MVKNKVDIRHFFLGLQQTMQSKFRLAKQTTHPVTKGDANELEWLQMLSNYLPTRYCADKAFVIDSEGNVSHQIDIVIYDRHYSPFILRESGAKYIPAESVYAAIEVKPEITSVTIGYAAKKAASVRALKRTTTSIVHAGGKIKKPRKPFYILAGILAANGTLSLQLKEKNQKAAASATFLNFGCALNERAFWFRKSKHNCYVCEESNKGEALIFFFLNLLSELQQLGTVPAIDIQAYAKVLKDGKKRR
ncbi:MAG: hypothetical protein PHN49_07335 [Candidatus Omnitrophica bacterium]|nr:hypothetical protein [Candidatus Omnitrophota bacterium]